MCCVVLNALTQYPLPPFQDADIGFVCAKEWTLREASQYHTSLAFPHFFFYLAWVVRPMCCMG